jgi:hypothetical protein
MKNTMKRDLLQTLTLNEVMTIERMRLRSGWCVKPSDIEYLLSERLIRLKACEGSQTYEITHFGYRTFEMLTASIDREIKGSRSALSKG